MYYAKRRLDGLLLRTDRTIRFSSELFPKDHTMMYLNLRTVNPLVWLMVQVVALIDEMAPAYPLWVGLGRADHAFRRCWRT